MRILHWSAILMLFVTVPVLAKEPGPGKAPEGGSPRILPRSRALGDGLKIDRSRRSTIVAAYQNYYKKFINTRNAWTGSVSGCRAGNNSTEYDNATLEMLKYFRAMAGLPADVEFSATLNKFAQDAALIMEGKNDLNHNPPSNWPCYTESGKKGASSSNLCLGCVGPYAIATYMDDRGISGVGHRNWVLLPSQKVLGTGSTARAHALYVFGDHRSNEEVAYIKEVAWPPSGFVPSDFGLDSGYPWSYTRFDRADLSGARMTLSHNGQSIAVRAEPAKANALVVYPTGLSKSTSAGSGYRVDVKIENAKINGQPQTIQYSVRFIDASAPQEDTDQAEVSTVNSTNTTNTITTNTNTTTDTTTTTTTPTNTTTTTPSAEDVRRLSEQMLLACYEGKADLTRKLLTQGANPNADYKGWTGLMYAAYFGHDRVVNVLLKANADPKIKLNGWSAGALAKSNGHDQIAELLLSKTNDRSMPAGDPPQLP